MKHYITPPSSRRIRRGRIEIVGADPPAQPQFRRQAAIAGGAIAGGLIGNIPGAFVGAYLADRATRNSVSQTKKNMPKEKAVNQLINKSAKKVTGKVTLSKDRKVKVSEYLKAAIKQTMAKETAVGTLTTRSMGYVGYGLGDPADITIAGTGLGLTGAAAVMPGYQGANGQRCLFNQLMTYNVGAASTAIAGSELNFFTPGKIWNAASCLFNQKSLSATPYTTTNNLATSFVASTGVTNANSSNSLKINVLSSMVQMGIKNTSNRVVTLEIWELEPTLKFQDVAPLQSLLSLATAVTDSTTEARNWYVQNAVGGVQNPILDSFLDPVAQMQKCGYKFRGKKRSMVLAPDETCFHSIKGPSGVLDWKQMNVDGTNQVFCMKKNWSVGCIISVVPDMVVKVSGPDTASKSILFPAITSSGYLNLPIAVEMAEFYKIAVPEIAGFINGVHAGAVRQTLNHRRTRNMIYNLHGGHGLITAGAYEVSNEENPIASAVTDSRT